MHLAHFLPPPKGKNMTWILKDKQDTEITVGSEVTHFCVVRPPKVYKRDLDREMGAMIIGKVISIPYPLLEVRWNSINCIDTYSAKDLGLIWFEILLPPELPPELPTSVDLLIRNLEEALRAYRERQNA
jgi:hypothetical protein